MLKQEKTPSGQKGPQGITNAAPGGNSDAFLRQFGEAVEEAFLHALAYANAEDRLDAIIARRGGSFIPALEMKERVG